MPLHNFTKYSRDEFSRYSPYDKGLIILILAAVLLLLAIGITYYRATQQQLSKFETPIKLTKEVYSKDEIIQGYFDGEKIYNGKVDIDRQISCSDGYQDGLADLRDGDDVVSSVLPARVIDGTKPRSIARVPKEITDGASCVITFDHTACIPYLFACYEQHYNYSSAFFKVEDKTTSSEPSINVQAAVPQTTSNTNSQDMASASSATSLEIFPSSEPANPTSQSGFDRSLESINGFVEAVTSPITAPINKLLGGN